MLFSYRCSILIILCLLLLEPVILDATSYMPLQLNKWQIGLADTVQNAVQKQAEFAGSLFKHFEEFIRRYGKTYGSATEKLIRFDIFKNNLKLIERLNAEEKGDVKYGINSFSDLSGDEFKAMYFPPLELSPEMELARRDPKPPQQPPGKPEKKSGPLRTQNAGLLRMNSPSPVPSVPPQSASGSSSSSKRPREDTTPPRPPSPKRPQVAPNPLSFDWRKDNPAYPPVESNRGCGACYAFATCGAIEIVTSKRVKKVQRYSKQQIVDCSANNKCAGGLIVPSLAYCKSYGLLSAEIYPYTAQNGTCDAAGYPISIRVVDYRQVNGDESMEKELPSCPLLVGMTFNYECIDNLQHYKGGVLSPERCNDMNIMDHAAVLIGYGTTTAQGNAPAKSYWIFRNDFGDDWGDKGHFMVERGYCHVGLHVYRFTLPPGYQ